MHKIARYGWRRDIPDFRDFKYAEKHELPVTLPNLVDLRSKCSSIEDQLSVGSCTANALVGNLEFLELKDKLPYTELSRLFIYYNERVIEHTVNEDSGAELRDGIKSLASIGVCPEQMWPYVPAAFKHKPDVDCYNYAKYHKISIYSRLSTLTDMRACLATGYPFVFGFAVYESFESEEVASTGKVNIPKRSESLVGGHAVMAVGYNDKLKRFIVRNSWGVGWGIKGYFTFPYDYAANPELSSDFWTIRK
jgi:C1A family cysteine protease